MIEILVTQPEFAEREQRIFRSLIGERVHPCNGVPKYPIRINKAVDARLQRTFSYLQTGLGRSRGGTIAHRQIAELEPFKESRPSGID